MNTPDALPSLPYRRQFLRILQAFFLFFLLMPVRLSAAGETEPGAQRIPRGEVILPAQGTAGQACAVIFRLKQPAQSVSVTLQDAGGRTLTSAKGFLLPDRRPARFPYVYAALTGFSVYLEPAVYTLEYTVILENGRQIRKTRSLPVSAPQWPTETIRLDERNTGIRTDQSEERRAQIDKLNAILFSAQEDAPRFTGPYQKPVDSERITSGFGDRREFVYSGGGSDISAHYGLDFGVPTGTPVRAAGSGRVVMAENRISTGWSVVLEHLPGLYSLYYHLDELLCAAGDTVTAGSIIGKSGATGLATGPHLHWEFRLNGEAVSPDFFLQDGFARLGADTFR